MDRKLIITIDTEGDNLWTWKQGAEVHTRNVQFLERFQELANRYGFFPTWLSNYEMINDDNYIRFADKYLSKDLCEIGMHLHAWNSPPLYTLKAVEHPENAPYLIEYPVDIIEEKISYLTEYIEKRVGKKPVSHRAGRWAMNQAYFDLLAKYGYLIDCSVTPHVDWTNTLGQSKDAFGTNYYHAKEQPHWISTGYGKLMECPVTIRMTNRLRIPAWNAQGLKYAAKRIMKGQVLWFRPHLNNHSEMIELMDMVQREKDSYLMFMLHSSELMPGGSPTFKTQDDIERLYSSLDSLFNRASRFFTGATLEEYYQGILDNRGGIKSGK